VNDADDSLQQKIRRHYIESSLRNSWLMVGFRFYYSVFSTYNLILTNMVVSMNSFRLVHFESLQCGSSRFWDPRFGHNLIGQHQICRIGISAGPLGACDYKELI